MWEPLSDSDYLTDYELNDCSFFDIYLELEISKQYREFKGFDEIFEQYCVANPAKYFRKAPYLCGFKIMLLNIISNHQSQKKFVAISRDTNFYNLSGIISVRPIRKILDWLEKEFYITTYPGVRKKWQTRIKANEKLLNLLNLNTKTDINPKKPVIILKDTNKKSLEIEETAETKGMIKILVGLNAILGKTMFQIDGREIPRQFYYRVFNDSSWDFGGRFYGATIQSERKENRAKLKIDSNDSVELDFSAMHVNILYEGRCPYPDPYIIDGYERDDVKLAILLMINTKSKKQAIWAFAKDLLMKNKPKDKSEIAKLFNSIEAKHQGICKEFYTCKSKRLQNTDSKVAESIVKEFVEHQHPIIVIHDGFIVSKDHQDILTEAMNRACQEVLGYQIKIKAVNPSPLVDTKKAA